MAMFSPCSELVVFTYWTGKSMNNLSSYCGLVDAKIRASDKDLPVFFPILPFVHLSFDYLPFLVKVTFELLVLPI